MSLLLKSFSRLSVQFRKLEVSSWRHFSHCLSCQRNNKIHHSKRLTRYFSSQYDSDDELERMYGSYENPEVELDWEYISKSANKEEIRQNILNRKGVGDIDKVHDLLEKQMSIEHTDQHELFTRGKVVHCEPVDFYQYKRRDLTDTERQLWDAALALPNRTHPQVSTDPDSEGTLLATIGREAEFDFKPRTVVELGEHLDGLRISDVNLTTGPHTYYLQGPLAMMEQALIRYTIDILRKQGFKMMSVPDLIYPEIIEGCGFATTGDRNQIYRLEPERHGDVCLSGTGEMPLAGFCNNHGFAWEELPQKLMAVSRCYRAESSSMPQHQGIYRVHQFTKVEMLGFVGQEHGERESQEMMDHFLDVQKQIFAQLGLALRIIDMPAHELGAPAYRKYDIEAWMPAKQFWGEISSTSNCTDYQSRRLDICYWNKAGELKHCHTVNGTGCAVPRMIMALLETHQQKDKSISVPEVLKPYMDGLAVLEPKNKVIMKQIKFTNTLKKNMKV